MIPRQIRFTRAVLAGTISLALCAAFGGSPIAAGAPDGTTTDQGVTLAKGTNWSVEAASAGYTVTLDLPAPLEARAAAPVLYVDGAELGAAVESADGLSLSVTTMDAWVLDASTVTYAFDGSEPTAPIAAAPAAADAPAAPAAPAAPYSQAMLSATSAVIPDPIGPGQYTVEETVYDLGTQAIDLDFIGGIKGEFRAKVYFPPGRQTPAPVVILEHGRHGSCGGSPANPARYPCGAAQTEIPSYAGYDATGRGLAANGYVVVSVSANAINSNDNQLAYDYGATARGKLILDHLDYLAKANAGSVEGLGTALTGRLDMTKIGIMGHSRGGEGAVLAAQLNRLRDKPLNIISLLPLAPVDFVRETVPEIPMLTILPYCDGDVSNLMGQHFTDDSVTAFRDDVLRSTLLVQGANHNYFNTIWTPGGFAYSTSDDWGSGATGQGINPVCGGNAAVAATSMRLAPADQHEIGAILMTAWFRLTVGDEQKFLGLFDGSGGTTERLTELNANFVSTASAPASDTTMINTFEDFSTAVRPVGSSTTAFCADMSGSPYQGPKPLCATQLGSSQGPHWSRARFAPSAEATGFLKYTWTTLGTGANATELRVDVPPSARNVIGREALTFRAAPGELATAASNLRVTVRDGSGGAASALTADYSAALAPQPYNATTVSGSTTLHKTILTQVYIPTTVLNGVDLSDVRRIDFTPLAANGTALLSDLAFTDSALGTAQVETALPLLTMGEAYVNEGNGPGTALMPVRLNKPTDHVVSGSFEVTPNVIAGGSGSGTALGHATTMSRFTIPVGQICTTVEVPINGNRNPATTPTTTFPGTATAVRGAATALAFGLLTIREDDAVVTADNIVLPLAPEPEQTGNPCGEPLPSATPEPAPTVTVTETPPPGPTVTVTEPAQPAPTVTITEPPEPGTTTIVTQSAAPAPTVTVTGAAKPGPTTIVTQIKTASAAPAATVTVNAFADEKPPIKASASIKAKLKIKRIIKGSSKKVRITISVKAAGAAASGKVRVLVGGKSLKTAKLKNGKVTVTLPKAKTARLKVGKHKVSVRFLGSAKALPTTKAGGVLRVTRR